MNYETFLSRRAFNQDELLALAHGNLVDDPPADFGARLPMPPMLMVDRITEISGNGRRGQLKAERDVRRDDWFFQCHFLGDPVQPGCLGVDAIWQLLGFFAAWRGALGSGRALGCGEIEFSGQIRPHNQCVRYEIDVRRYVGLEDSNACLIVGNGRVLVDDELIYKISNARVGLFRGITYDNYPWPGPQANGGVMQTKRHSVAVHNSGQTT